jgi:cytochrome P450
VNFLRRLKGQVVRFPWTAATRPGDPAPAPGADRAASFSFDDPRSTHAPFAAFEDLRRDGEVHFLPRHGHWIVLGHDSVKEALARPDAFSSRPQEQVDSVLIGADPPRHEKPRRIVARFLTGTATAGLAADARTDAASLVRPAFDLVGDFAVPLARAAAARLVGLEAREVAAVLTAPDLSLPAAEMTSGSRALLERSRLFGVLLGEAHGDFNSAAASSLVRLLCRAATETTERLIVRAGAAWLAEAGLREEVARDPSAMAAFIEEIARLFPPEPNVVRLTTSATSLAGTQIPENAHVFLSLLAANRDPKRFDQPERLRLDRGRSAHLAFSGGPHQCIGAGLGRQLAAAALACLAEHKVRALDPGAPPDLAVVQGIATPRRLMVAA